MTKIEFPIREKLVEFLNQLLNLGCPYDFEVEGKQIVFHYDQRSFAELPRDEMVASMALACGGIFLEDPPRGRPVLATSVDDIQDLVRDHSGPAGEILTDSIASQQELDHQYQQMYPELWPHVETLERAAENLAFVRRCLKPWEPAAEVDHKVSRAQALLGTAARRYTHAVNTKIRSE